MNCYKEHALQEFKAAGWMDSKGKYNCEMQKLICNHILKLLKVFDSEGHSGATASYTINLFKKLALFETITPLTGEDDEWSNKPVDETGTLQNKRDSAVFKDATGSYYLNAIAFRGEKSCFTGSSEWSNGVLRSRQYIKKFPFTPKTFYVDVIETEWADKEETVKQKGGGWWTNRVKDETQLSDVFKYYKENPFTN